MCVPPKVVAETSVALTKMRYSKGSRGAPTPEEVVSTYIQNCLSTWERLDVAAIFFIYVGAPLGPDLVGGPEALLSTWEPLWGPV